MRPYRFTIIAAVVLISIPALAEAEVVTLVCTTSKGYTETLDVDLNNQTVCFMPSFARPPCARSPAQISNRYVVFNGAQSITLDRETGIIRWIDGSTGTCRRSSGDILR